jgi:hypothetical protein
MVRLQDFDARRGRAVLIGAALLIWGGIIWSFISNGYVQTWEIWHISTMYPPFLDLRLIPGATETFQAGMDPALSNPYDPAGRFFNYPKIWYLLFPLNITQDDVIWISIVLIVLFFLVLFVFPERIRVRDAILFLPFVFSPACMLLYERGNVDLIFFILSGITIMLVNHLPIVAAGVLLIAAFFKLFPFFGIVIFFQENKKRFYAFLGAITGVFLLYLFLDLESLKSSWQLTEQGTYTSYGVFVVFDLLYSYFRYYLLKVMSEDQFQTSMSVIPYVFTFLLLIVVFYFAMRQNAEFPVYSGRNLAAFRLGAAIYAGTFLLGNNWDYRLAFLLFTIPQLSYCLFVSSGKLRWAYLGLFVVMAASFWGPVIFDYGIQILGGKYKLKLMLLDEAMNWSLFLGLTYMLIASSPDWFRTLSLNPFSSRQPVSALPE